MKKLVKEALQAGISGDSQKMRESNEYLQSIRSAPGLIQACVDISLTDESLEMRQLSSIFLKNLTKVWKDSKRDYPLPSADKDFLKSNILSFLFYSIPDKIRAQYGEIAFNICKSDFPWDLILVQIDQFLNSSQLEQIFSALTMISQISKVYEHKLNDRRGNLKILVVKYFKSMRLLMKILMNETDENRFRYMALVLQIYWTCFYTDLPEEQATIENLQDWLSICRDILAMDMTGLNSLTTPDLIEDHPKWVCKKWSAQILHRFFNKYFNTLYLRDHHKFIGEYFQSTWAIPLSQEIVALLMASKSLFLPKTVKNYLLKFLMQAFRVPVTSESLQPSAQLIISELIMPNLQRTAEDEVLWKENPVEFIRTETDLGKAYFCPKTSAAELLKSICERNNLAFFMGYLVELLSSSNLLVKESCLYALGALNKIIKINKQFLPDIEGILCKFALQELESPVGFLRSRACWLYSCYSDLHFKDESQLDLVLSKVCKLMLDPELPVRIEAATALPKFFDWENAKFKISSELQQVLSIYIELISQIDYEELIESLEDIVTHFSVEVRPFALDLCKCLVSAFISMSSREGDETVVAAESVLNTLGKIIDVLDDDFEALGNISLEVTPILDLVFSLKDLNFFDPALSILSSLLYYCPAGYLPHLWKYAGVLYNYVIDNGKVRDFVKDNLEDIFPPFGNYLKKYKQLCTENISLFISLASVMVNDGYIQLSIGCKIFMAIIENSNGEQDIIQQVMMKSYQVFTATESKKIKVFYVQIVMNCLWKNCEFTLQYMKKLMCFEPVFLFVADNHMILKDELQLLQTVFGMLAVLACAAKGCCDGIRLEEIVHVFVLIWKRLQGVRGLARDEAAAGNLQFDVDDEDYDGAGKEMYESVLEEIEVGKAVKGYLSAAAPALEGLQVNVEDLECLRMILI